MRGPFLKAGSEIHVDSEYVRLEPDMGETSGGGGKEEEGVGTWVGCAGRDGGGAVGAFKEEGEEMGVMEISA